MSTTSTIGIDVGGTFVRAGTVDPNGRVVAWRRCHTPRDATGASLVATVADIVQQVSDEEGERASSISGIGLALPGIIKDPAGLLTRSVNLRGVEGYPLADALSDRLQLPVRLMTDMQAATWAEYSACRPAPTCFVHLRLGTGVGLCTVTDGRLERVDESRTTHHPLLVVDRNANAEKCACGLRGCLENIASASALIGAAEPGDHTAALTRLRSAYEARDVAACEIMEAAASAVTKALGNVAGARQADHICIGGGVAAALPVLVRHAIDRFSLGASSGTRPPLIAQARLGDQAGVIGAAQLQGTKTC